MVGLFSALARAAGPAVFSDGEYLAISELQRSESYRTAIAAHRDPIRRAHLPDLELLPTGPARPRFALRQHRYLHSSRRYYSPQVSPASTFAAPGASDRLTCTLVDPHHRLLSLQDPR